MAKARKGFYQMNDQQLDKKVRQDAAKVRKDIDTLVGHSATRLSRLEGDVSQATGKAKKDLTTWVEGNASQMSKRLEKMTSSAKEIVLDTATTFKKDVGHSLSQYNAKAQKAADNMSGVFGKKAARYPWVGISIALVVGLLLGIIFRPGRQPVAQYQI